jgi:RNA polymerase sigma factor for flagellar operon FliA
MVRKYPEKAAAGNSSGLDQKERQELIVEYAYLVNHIAGRMSKRLPASVDIDELISAGCLGLIDAVDKYDAKKDVSLKTYAQYRIKGAILDELRSMDWYSRSMRKKIQDIEKALRRVEFRTGLPAGETEVAGELGIDLAAYHKMVNDIHQAAVLNLDSFIRNENNDSSSGNTFLSSLRSTDDPSGSVVKEELKQVLAKAIKGLSEKEQIVISLYYYEELTLKEIGKVLDLTESRICQIHTMAVLKLKTRLNSYYWA